MSTLIRERQWDDIRKLTEEELEDKPSCELKVRGKNYRFFMLRISTKDYVVADNLLAQAEYLGQRTNSVAPPEPPILNSPVPTPFQEALAIVNSLCCPDCEFVAKSDFGLMAHRRKHSREKESVSIST